MRGSVAASTAAGICRDGAAEGTGLLAKIKRAKVHIAATKASRTAMVTIVAAFTVAYQISRKNNVLLTDIAVEHTLASKNGGPRETLFLHPFTNTQRDSLGKFEIARSVGLRGTKEVRSSTFVSFQHLAELYAKGVLDEFGFSVRMCAADRKYATTTPLKKILPTSIKPGSPFDLAVQGIDVSKPANRELRTALLRTGVKL